MKIKTKDMIKINDLVQVSSTTLDNKINNYIMEINKEESTLYIDAYQQNGGYSVFIKKELEEVEEDETINIANSVLLGEILSNIVDEKEINIKMTKDGVLIDKDEIKLATYEPDEDEKKYKKNLKNFLNNRNYGEKGNKLVLYEDEENPKPDAICRIELDKLKAKKINKIFSPKNINLSVEKGSLFLKVSGNNTINRKIRKIGKDDETSIKGSCSVVLSNLSCIYMLSKFSGFVDIILKDGYPMLLKKYFPDEKLGISYVVSLAQQTS